MQEAAFAALEPAVDGKGNVATAEGARLERKARGHARRASPAHAGRAAERATREPDARSGCVLHCPAAPAEPADPAIALPAKPANEPPAAGLPPTPPSPAQPPVTPPRPPPSSSALAPPSETLPPSPGRLRPPQAIESSTPIAIEAQPRFATRRADETLRALDDLTRTSTRALPFRGAISPAAQQVSYPVTFPGRFHAEPEQKRRDGVIHVREPEAQVGTRADPRDHRRPDRSRSTDVLTHDARETRAAFPPGRVKASSPALTFSGRHVPS